MFGWLKRNKRNLTLQKSKIKYCKYGNNLGYDEVIREKQEEYVIWYGGDSNELLDYYINARPSHSQNYEYFRNAKDYFWAVVGREDEVKCTHSGLPKVIINTLVNILGIPEITSSKENEEDGKIVLVDDEVTNDRIKKIIEDNNFINILTQDQVPYTMVVGDGAYFVNIDKDLSDYPIIEFIDGRNVEFERKANRIVAITARKYFTHNKKGYMLTDTRSAKWVTDETTGKRKRVATIEYHLYELTNEGSDEVREEVKLDAIPQTKDLESLEFLNIDMMLAVPCIYRYNKEIKRGESFFAGKLDLFDDLDQSKSQASNVTRLSTPVDYIPEGLMDYDKNGNPIKPNRYDRRFVTLPRDRDAVGQNVNKVETTQPDLNFNQYNENQLELVMDILSGLMSPATLGIDLARKDNAAAQREKEKVTLITRDFLVDQQTQILKRLFTLVLKVHDFMLDETKVPREYNITINYPEYANPTFEAKLQALIPAFVSGAMSARQYVNELWGEALSEEEKEQEIATLEQYKNASTQIQDTFDSMMLE